MEPFLLEEAETGSRWISLSSSALRGVAQIVVKSLQCCSFCSTSAFRVALLRSPKRLPPGKPFHYHWSSGDFE